MLEMESIGNILRASLVADDITWLSDAAMLRRLGKNLVALSFLPLSGRMNTSAAMVYAGSRRPPWSLCQGGLFFLSFFFFF